MDEDDVDFYSQERWDNWLDRVTTANIDDEEEASRLYLNLQNDTAIAVAKVLKAHDDGHLDAEEANEELATIRSIVLEEPSIEDEDAAILIDAVQTSLVGTFAAADRYLLDEPVDKGSIPGLVDAAVEAEDAEAYEEALGYIADVGWYVIDGEELPIEVVQDLEYGLVSEWLGGLDSLQEALRGPKVIEEEE